jgi:hypothetical protein
MLIPYLEQLVMTERLSKDACIVRFSKERPSLLKRTTRRKQQPGCLCDPTLGRKNQELMHQRYVLMLFRKEGTHHFIL